MKKAQNCLFKSWPNTLNDEALLPPSRLFSNFISMPYSEPLADRIRRRLAELPDVEEKQMMGGLVFMYNGKMLVGVIKDDLMCRIDPELHSELVERAGCRTMESGKRSMTGYVLIDESGMARPQDFEYWVNLALDFNPKAKAARKYKT